LNTAEGTCAVRVNKDASTNFDHNAALRPLTKVCSLDVNYTAQHNQTAKNLIWHNEGY
jgi:hypothetical protein